MYDIPLDLCTALMDKLGLYVYFASALVSPIFHTLIVCDFCKTAFGNLGLLAITAPNY